MASEIQRIQETYGNDTFAVLTGASLTNEKAYLMGKFARVALRTANIDYNGRLCMVSAGAASKKIFGIDRSANPWSDIPKARSSWSRARTLLNARRSPPTICGRRGRTAASSSFSIPA